MSNKPIITYLLGAGASAFAVPTVKYFPLVLQKFHNHIKNLIKNSNLDNSSKKDALQKVKIIEEIGNFATVDTWARKLFLSKNYKYEHLKEIISLFLIYCQIGSKESIDDYLKDASLLAKSGIYEIHDKDFSYLNQVFQNVLDPRYDLFLGSILNKDNTSDKLYFPDNVNIISWNYDSQFETSLKTYSSEPILRKNNTPFEIQKLNGSANFTINSDKQYLAFNFNFEKEFNFSFLDSIISILGRKDYHKVSYENQLRFAWEMGSEVVSKAKSIISKTDVLVVIGYTFPSFNQEVERMIFDDNSKIQKVYYQTPENEYDSLLERINGTIFKGAESPTFSKDKHRVILSDVIPVKFINVKDMNQFYIPNEFYM